MVSDNLFGKFYEKIFQKQTFYLVIVLAVALITVFMQGRMPDLRGDARNYIKMAEDSPKINREIGKPFIYRPLGPYIVGLMPTTIPTGFYISTIFLSVMLVSLFYLFLCHFKIHPAVSAFTTILFILNSQIFGRIIWNYFQIVDMLTMIFVVAAWWTMINHKWKIFGLIILFGVLNKATILVMIPVSFVYLWESNLLSKNIKEFSLSILPAILVFVSLRIAIRPEKGLSVLEAFLTHTDKLTSIRYWGELVINTFLPFSLIPIIFYNETISFFKQNKYRILFVTLVFISTFLGSGIERLFAPSFIMFYLLLANIIQDYFYANYGILTLFGLTALVASVDNQFGLYTLRNVRLAIVISLISLIITTTASYFARLKKIKT